MEQHFDALMPLQMTGDSVETEVLKDINGSTPRLNVNDLILRPVYRDESGEGLPYAPENWPNPGDNWSWKVGKRVSTTGHFLDRYLYPPRYIPIPENSSRRGQGFASKLSVERFIQSVFPNADVDAFFSSFSWKIPAKKSSSAQGTRVRHAPCPLPSKEKKEWSASDSQIDIVGCKAGNKNCNSLSLVENPSLLKSISCDICCGEPRFCRDCCCILCSKIIDTSNGNYSYIKCEAMVDGYICGHHAHIKCGLRSYMAGTVGGSIGLDAEYYCRRCDARTDLVSHVQRFLQSCQSTDSRDDTEKILHIGVCILRGSKKPRAKKLLRRIELITAKLRSGTCLEEIWKMDEDISANCTDAPDHANIAIKVSHDSSDSIISSEWTMTAPFDHWTESLKLEDEIDQVLQALQKSQEFEYNLAEEKLQVHKKYIDNLFQQLDREQAELTHRTPSTWTSSTGPDALVNKVLNRVDQIKREVKKLKRMEKVADGFGKTPKDILNEDFGLEDTDTLCKYDDYKIR